MTKRRHHLPLLFIILVSAAALPGQLSEIKTNWPLIRLWPDPAAQMTVMLDDVPYQTLKTAAEQLAPDVAILLVTSGQDVRRREYTTYHRALYLLTSRPVWWLSPAPADNTWESRWWISRPLTAKNIAAVAEEKSADCLLLINVPAQPAYGPSVSQLPNGEIIQVGSKNCLANAPTPITNYPTAFWPLRLLPALLIIMIFGFGFLVIAKNLNGRISPLETIALSWLLGAGLLSIFMFWLNGLGFSLNNQVIILATAALPILFWQRHNILQSLSSSRFNLHLFRFENNRWRRTAALLLTAFLLFQLLFVVLMAAGRPLTIWDSWVNWAGKARTIFLENGISPALYADPSRQVMLLGYPLSIPLLEAWLYRWLGAPDDRLVGLLFVFTYLALGGFIYGFCRRRGLEKITALLILGTALSLGHIVGLTAAAFTDLWLAVLLLVAAAFLMEWLETKQTGHLLIAAIAAGQLTWLKQEGLILVIALLLAATLTILFQIPPNVFRSLKIKSGNSSEKPQSCHSESRVLKSPENRSQNKRLEESFTRITRLFAITPTNLQKIGIILLPTWSFIGLAALIFVLPWRLFAAREAALVSVFLPLTLDNILANLDRLPTIISLVGLELFNHRTGLIWPVTAAVFLNRTKQLSHILKRPSILLLLIPIIYLPIISIPYLISDFVPYQQHILSSFFRINAHTLPLTLLWIAIETRTLQSKIEQTPKIKGNSIKK